MFGYDTRREMEQDLRAEQDFFGVSPKIVEDWSDLDAEYSGPFQAFRVSY